MELGMCPSVRHSLDNVEVYDKLVENKFSYCCHHLDNSLENKLEDNQFESRVSRRFDFQCNLQNKNALKNLPHHHHSFHNTIPNNPPPPVSQRFSSLIYTDGDNNEKVIDKNTYSTSFNKHNKNDNEFSCSINSGDISTKNDNNKTTKSIFYVSQSSHLTHNTLSNINCFSNI